MSAEFYLPIALNLAPPKWLAVAIAAAHLLPLPVIAIIFDAHIATVIAALATVSLAIALLQQRPATAATTLTAHARPTAEEEWWLGYADGKSARVELESQVNFGWWVLLCLRKNRRRFRVTVPVAGQRDGQVHRLQVRGAVTLPQQ